MLATPLASALPKYAIYVIWDATVWPTLACVYASLLKIIAAVASISWPHKVHWWCLINFYFLGMNQAGLHCRTSKSTSTTDLSRPDDTTFGIMSSVALEKSSFKNDVTVRPCISEEKENRI